MATYNGERYLREQVDSILSQLNPEDELVVSDDGSTDSTLFILDSYHDSRIKVFEKNLPHGINANFENALLHARGKYIFLSDQDDVWIDGKVDACMAALKTADCIVHDSIVVDGNLGIVFPSFFAFRNCRAGFWHNWLVNGYSGNSMAFRRELLTTLLPIPHDIPFYHDMWIGLISDAMFKVKFIETKGVYFRRHNHTASCAGIKSLSMVKKISYRIQFLYYIVKRIFEMNLKSKKDNSVCLPLQ